MTGQAAHVDVKELRPQPPRGRCHKCGTSANVYRVEVRRYGPRPITFWCSECGTAWPIHPPGTPEHDVSLADIADWDEW